VLIVAALGGNALLPRGASPDIDLQRHHVATAMVALATLLDAGHRVVLTHGNGPQVGLLAVRSMGGPGAPEPFDVLGAESEGMIGYLLEQALRNVRPGIEVATLLTQTLVDADDPAFGAPTKFVGLSYSETEARRVATDLGWTVARDGHKWRRVVPSPEPRAFLEITTIRLLVSAGVVVVCSGGGGIPVAVTPAGGLVGVEAVIDKDLAAALLASCIDADALLLLTDVAAVLDGWGGPAARPIRKMYAQSTEPDAFPAGSMGPKIEACRRFTSARPGGIAAIGALDEAVAILDGSAGTRVLGGAGTTTYW
jgi:carbamate kinase